MLEQSEIDALLSSAGDAGSEIGPVFGAEPERKSERPVHHVSSKELQRILNMRFPVMVNLADRNMTLKQILGWSNGSIIEFDRSSDAELELTISNQKIGRGQAVKVGEYFGLKITGIESVEDRIRAMGE